MINKPVRIAFILLFVVFSFAAEAQRGNQTSLSAGSELLVPLNMNKYQFSGPGDNIRAGFGLNLKLEKPITETLHFTVGAGLAFTESDPHYLYLDGDPAYTDYVPDRYYNNDYHQLYVYLPVTAGLKYYLAKYFYVSAEAGGAFKTSFRARTSFIYSGGGGAVIPIGAHHGLDFGLRFERGYKNIDYDHAIDQLGLNVAYKYRF